VTSSAPFSLSSFVMVLGLLQSCSQRDVLITTTRPQTDTGVPGDVTRDTGAATSSATGVVSPSATFEEASCGVLDASAASGSADGLTEAVCESHLQLWKAYDAAYPSDPNDLSQVDDCFPCVLQSTCQRPAGTCAAGSDCAMRHCLCSPESSSQCFEADYTDDLCSCLPRCFEVTSPCVAEWQGYMLCLNDACGQACESD
jgi:hypothetical protein